MLCIRILTRFRYLPMPESLLLEHDPPANVARLDMPEHAVLAAVDLGSNSFHLQVARVVGNQLYPLDAIKEPVRLAAGLDAQKRLDGETQARALDCLARFAERLKAVPEPAVRAVGTSALRVAKNAPDFVARAEATLGVPIEVVSGREEARLIYIGVAHSLAASRERRLVIDIGGGSTECIIGAGITPGKRESLRMGCVNFTRQFFPDNIVDKSRLKAAELAARNEAQSVVREFSRGHWEQAVGSSGTAKALAEIMTQSGVSQGTITAAGLEWLKGVLLKAGRVDRMDLPGLKPDRKPVLAGGFAVMNALFAELRLGEMAVAQGAMREGILYDLYGRFHDEDMRDATVTQFMRRHHVDSRQSARVEKLAMDLLQQVESGLSHPELARQCLTWAARLHEVGLTIAHSGWHKHSAYIVENADMPGFSRIDQTRLALLLRVQKGALAKVPDMQPARMPLFPGGHLEQMILALILRLAVLFYRSRTAEQLPGIELACGPWDCRLTIDPEWMRRNALTEAALRQETEDWAEVGFSFGLA
jgi:exopolyphosphatase / guanosine-5'-triphosphate,3'-diphosphate pyrophosphatase